VNLVPVFIVSIAGLNAKFLVSIEFNPAAGIRVVGVVVAGFGWKCSRKTHIQGPAGYTCRM
jgi:hypothetical protein